MNPKMFHHFLIGVLLFLRSISADIIQNEPFQLLAGLENCDLQIILDPRSSHNLAQADPLPIPVTMVNLSPLANFCKEDRDSNKCYVKFQKFHKAFMLNIFKGRGALARLSFILLEPHLLVDRLEDAAYHVNTIVTRSQLFHFADGYAMIQSTVNLFPVVFSKRVEFITALEPRNGGFGCDMEFMATVRSSPRGHGVQLCLRIQGLDRIPHSDTNCIEIGAEYGNIVQILKRYTTPQKSWTISPSPGDVEVNETNNQAELTTLVKPVNPFNRLAKQSVNFYLVLNIAKKDNASLFLQDQYAELPELVFKVFECASCINVVTEYDSFSFLSCYATKSVTFEFYISPFEPEVWCALLASGFLLVIILWRYLKYREYQGSFCPWMYVLGAILEDGVPVPGTIEGQSAFRLVFGCWIIVCVLLSNFYNGLMITGLNSPLFANRVETFRDLVCDWMSVQYSENGYNFEMTTNWTNHAAWAKLWFYRENLHNIYDSGEEGVKLENFSSSDCFGLLSFLEKKRHSGHKQWPDFLKKLYESFKYFLNFDRHRHNPGAHNQTQVLWVNLFHPKHRHFPRNVSNPDKLASSEFSNLVEQEVVDCGKTVFVAKTPQIVAEREYLWRNYPWINFYKGRDSLYSFPFGLSIRRAGTSRIPRYYETLLESGIGGRLMIEQFSRRNVKRQRARRVNPILEGMTMDGSILTLFIIWGGVVGLGLISLGVECWKTFE